MTGHRHLYKVARLGTSVSLIIDMLMFLHTTTSNCKTIHAYLLKSDIPGP